MVHQVGDRLREQIHRFSGELCTGLGKVVSRFVEEMVFGISASGSVVLTRIARSLEEGISLHDTHKRLSRNLGKVGIGGLVRRSLRGGPRGDAFDCGSIGSDQEICTQDGASG